MKSATLQRDPLVLQGRVVKGNHSIKKLTFPGSCALPQALALHYTVLEEKYLSS